MSQDHATIDFETYSEAGYFWNAATNKWEGLVGAQKKGLFAVGMTAYAEHPSTEVLVMSYKLPNKPLCRWLPHMQPPFDLFVHILSGGLIEAHNVMFERLIWHNIFHKRFGWADLPAMQLRCSSAKARVSNFPSALANLTDVLPTVIKKDKDGKRLINKFSIPRNPTAKDPRTRITPESDPEDAENIYSYCDTDVLSEIEVSNLLPDMSPEELNFWFYDQEINWTGIAVDLESISCMKVILGQALVKYGQEFIDLTGYTATQNTKIPEWLASHGVHLPNMQAETVEEALEWISRPEIAQQYPPSVRRALEIKTLIGSASVKKLYSLERTASNDGRIRNMIIHHGARTGRPTGEGAQPLNMPRSGCDVKWCSSCDNPNNVLAPSCRWCGDKELPRQKTSGWSFKAVEPVLSIMKTADLSTVEYFIGDALKAISGCLRSMFMAGEGKEFIASDFSAIEAVVTAELSGEEWRREAFRNKIDIYLASASKIERKPIEEYLAYRKEHGDHHPSRQKIGKPAELGLGFGGWLTAWRQFDSSDTFTDDEVKKNILAWRSASPKIPELWGGQFRGKPWEQEYRAELYGFEGCFVSAIQNPARRYSYAGIKFYMERDTLYIELLSGRRLAYQSPRLTPDPLKDGLVITYMTWNTDPKKGAIGWVPMKTYGGRIAENVIQATAHDILRYSIVNLWKAGYKTVLHVYDEIIVEVPEGWGTIEEMEKIMATMPPWCADWPVRATDGWRGKRYRKG